MRISTAIFNRLLIKNRNVFMGNRSTETSTEDGKNKQDKIKSTDVKPNQAELDKIKSLEQEMSTLNNKYLSSLAESENARKRFSKQMEDVKKYSIRSFIKELLPVIDSLDMAKQSASNDGISMIYNQFFQILTKNGITKQSVKVGDIFNPNYHEALYQKPITKYDKSNTICSVEKIGYNFKEMVLRASGVGVYK
ncbi:hypothetical protein A3Q56_04839 [Intoshia linei]|uniref:GrpE protein homolog n=1 Tax=Intoshia linei TaxID=1819745 RepID=A0A177AZH1_9BILA|nr:hypothetical protein A3Q56_04839 [Intoshia linei]